MAPSPEFAVADPQPSSEYEETLIPHTYTTYRETTIIDNTKPAQDLQEKQQSLEHSTNDWKQEQSEWRQRQEEQWRQQQERVDEMQRKLEDMQQELQQKDSLSPWQGYKGTAPEVNLANVRHAKTVLTAAIEDFSPVWYVIKI